VLPTFVIGLREGLEGSLIVGMVAAFLVKSGRGAALRYMWLGVIAALAVCTGIGITLEIISAGLPQKQQEGLETVIGAVAVAMVTYMVVWMRKHSRDLKGHLEIAANAALLNGSAWALVAMAALAVLREGLETAVFLIAAFDASGNEGAAGTGAVLGVLVAVALGWGIYRGGLRLNLGRFFRVTGVVLVLVAAGLVVSALHTAHEAGWLNVGQGSTVDLSWLVAPGSVRASLLTGMLGLQPHPVVIEVIGWAVYVIPVGVFVAWAPGRVVAEKWVRAALVGAASVSAVAIAASVAFAPSTVDPTRIASITEWTGTATLTDAITREKQAPVTVTGTGLTSLKAGAIAVPVEAAPDFDSGSAVRKGTRRIAGSNASYERAESRGGVESYVYTTSETLAAVALGSLPTSVTLDQLLAAGGRLPIGLQASQVTGPLPISYSDTVDRTYWVDPETGSIVDVSTHQVRTATVKAGTSSVTLATVSDVTVAASPAALSANAVVVERASAAQQRHDRYSRTVPIVLAVLALAAVAVLLVRRRGGAVEPMPVETPRVSPATQVRQ
jgi:high-affinity iron transporter